MIFLNSDYTAGAHPDVMERLLATNLEHTVGYGLDPYSVEARNMVRSACGVGEAEVIFLVGGTQTNATAIDGILRHHEGVLAADSGHIAIHEAGAIEASGHKVLTLPHNDGKVAAEDVERYITSFYADQTYEHMVAPGMLYSLRSMAPSTLVPSSRHWARYATATIYPSISMGHVWPMPLLPRVPTSHSRI